MNIQERIMQKGVILIALGMLIPFVTAVAQSGPDHAGPKQQVEFQIQGETHMSNVNEPTLMLGVVEQLQENPNLVRVKVKNHQRLDASNNGNDESLGQYEINASLKFKRYDEFNRWLQSDDTQQLLDELRKRLNSLILELQLVKK